MRLCRGKSRSLRFLFAIFIGHVFVERQRETQLAFLERRLFVYEDMLADEVLGHPIEPLGHRKTDQTRHRVSPIRFLRIYPGLFAKLPANKSTEKVNAIC